MSRGERTTERKGGKKEVRCGIRYEGQFHSTYVKEDLASVIIRSKSTNNEAAMDKSYIIITYSLSLTNRTQDTKDLTTKSTQIRKKSKDF